MEITKNTRFLKSRKFILNHGNFLKITEFGEKSCFLGRFRLKIGQIWLFWGEFKAFSSNFKQIKTVSSKNKAVSSSCHVYMRLILDQSYALQGHQGFKVGYFLIFNSFGVKIFNNSSFAATLCVNYLLDKDLLNWGHQLYHQYLLKLG